MSLRFSTAAAEGQFQASRWLQVGALLSDKELAELFSSMGAFELFITGEVVEEGQELVNTAAVLGVYSGALAAAREGRQVPRLSTLFLTVTADALYAVRVKEDRLTVRARRPVIVVRPYTLAYSQVDRKIRPHVHGPSAFFWGLEFAYPRLFQDPETGAIITVDESVDFPNTRLFRLLQRWLRSHTLPSPFWIGEERLISTARLGRHCFSWINDYPALQVEGLEVRR